MWLVYSINKETKAAANFYIGRRNNQILNVVIRTLLRAKAEKIYTDRLRNYQYLIPKSVHMTKKYGTNGIERKNLSVRTHLKRFTRRTICFSRSIKITMAIFKIYFWL